MGSIYGINAMEVRPVLSGLTGPGHFYFTPKNLTPDVGISIATANNNL